ncbi:MAG: glycosyltransferase [Patescibacteria group bacterium]
MKICMVTTSEIFHDSRILNEAGTLAKSHQVTILARKYPKQKNQKYPFKIKLIDFKKFPIFQLNIFSSFFSLAKAAFKENPDVYHAHDLDGLLCAIPAALRTRKILIYDSHELWSDTFPFANLRGIQWLLPILEKISMWKVKSGITVNDSLAKILHLKYGKKFISLYNAPAKQKIIKTKLDLRKQFPNKKIILHLGAADEGRGMEQMIEASKLLPANFILAFIGGGKTENELKTIIKKENLEKKVYFFPAVLPEQIIPIIKQVDLALALTQPVSKSYYYSLPNKIFQYIAAETPILGSNLPEFKKIILQNKIGEVVNPKKPRLIAEKILENLKKSPQNKYRRNLVGLAKTRYNWTVEGKKLELFYRDLEEMKNVS